MAKALHKHATITIAVHDRHIAVGDHHIETLLAPGAQAMGAVLGLDHLVAQVAQLLGQQQAVGLISRG